MNADKAEFQSERIKYMAQNDTRHTFNLLSKHNDLFFVENPGEADAALSFVGAGRINSLRNYTIERRKFPYCAVEFVSSGRLLLESESGKFELGAGSVFAYTPDSDFKLVNIGEGESLKYFMVFAGSEALKAIQSSNLAPCVPKSILRPNFMANFFEMLIDCKYFKADTGARIADKFVHALFEIVGSSESVGEVVSSASFLKLRKCKDFISKNFNALTSISDIAKKCGISQSHLNRIFLKYENSTPLNYLMHLKMNYAMNSMMLGKVSVKELAAEVGFEDQFYFSKVFKAHFGLSPRKYIGKLKAEISSAG